MNSIIAETVELVDTGLIHLRTPHDYYTKDFYHHHKSTLNSMVEIQSSWSKVDLLSNKPTRLNINSICPAMSEPWKNRLLDKTGSSCGFIARTKIFLQLWKKYVDHGILTDWFVRKELLQLYESVGSASTLSFYNNKRVSQVNNAEPLVDHYSTHEIVYRYFWKESSTRTVVIHQGESLIQQIKYCFSKASRGPHWIAAFLLCVLVNRSKLLIRSFRQ